MKRREFITLVGGTVAMWPLAPHAQQPERMRRIGVLMNSETVLRYSQNVFALEIAGDIV